MVDADPELLREFPKLLPKLELHAHLNGSISLATLSELYKDRPELTPWTGNVPNTQPAIFELFNQIHQVTDNVPAVRKATADVIREFHADNVIYLELRTTPRAVAGKMTKEEYLQAVIESIQEAANTLPAIMVKLLVSVCRHHSVESNRENLQLAISLHTKLPDLVVGVDFSGNSSAGTWKEMEPIAMEAREAGLKVTVHCGEQPSVLPEAVDILKFKPDRIGHATCIHPNNGGSEEVWQELLHSKIPVELCLSSNIKTKNVDSLENHPVKYFTASNALFTFCTDDKAIFNTTVSQEIQLAMANSEWNGPWNSGTLFWLSFRAVDFTFTSPAEKGTLRGILKKFSQPKPVDYPKSKLDEDDLA